jgi:hypothetical protein
MTKITLHDDSPVTPDHKEIDPSTGLQKGYVVLSSDDRAMGEYIRPIRRAYIHEKCGGLTTISLSIAQTYALNPEFYSGTFCAVCKAHFPTGKDGEFMWDGTTEKVGT